MNIDRIERKPRPPWTARSAGPKPTKLDEGSWLVEVVQVEDGTGVPVDEKAWWTECLLPRLNASEAVSLIAAKECAEAWYDETDQSGGKCAVTLKVTAWTGATWTHRVNLAWSLKVSIEPIGVKP